jgi:hypothetical protein
MQDRIASSWTKLLIYFSRNTINYCEGGSHALDADSPLWKYEKT